MAEQLHGGDRYRNHVKLDFSVNINPLGMPEYAGEALREAVRGSADVWEWYPDPVCSRLREALAAYHLVPKEAVLCGNGASELILAIVRAKAAYVIERDMCRGAAKGERKALRVVLPVPSFAEYERAAAAAGAQCIYHSLKKEIGFALTETVLETLTRDVDMLFLCNPNNPTGNLIPDALLRRILEHCRENKITVLLDECFLELSVSEFDKAKRDTDARQREEASRSDVRQGEEASRLDMRTAELVSDYPNLIVLKAFTKLYAMPGVRLGYCISTDRTLREMIKEQLPCWNVSGIAQLAGMTVLDNKKRIDYISQSRRLIREERDWLTKALEALGIEPVPGCANFICFYADALSYGNLYEKLLKKGILIRDCSGFRGMESGWYRIAVRPHKENERLVRAIQG